MVQMKTDTLLSSVGQKKNNSSLWEEKDLI